MKIAVNPHWFGKMPKDMSPDESKQWWRTFNGGFLNVDISNDDLAKCVRMGFAYASQHRQYRKRENFVQSQFVAVDYDTGDERSTFDYLLHDELISKYASFLHTTASHTNEHPRCRVVFELDRPIDKMNKYELLVDSFLFRLREADQACRDATRVNFGAVDCRIECVSGVFPLSMAEQLVEPYQLYLEQKYVDAVNHSSNGHANVSSEVVQMKVALLLEQVRTAPDGQKYHELLRISRLLGGLAGAGYVDANDAIQWLQSAIAQNQNNVQNIRHAFDTITKFVQYGVKQPYYLT
jgi:hypothetical protein